MIHQAVSVHEARDFFRRVRVDHEILRDLLGSLDAAFERARRERANERGRRADEETLDLLAELEVRLAEHFAREEQGEFIASAVRLAPRLARRTAGLFDDHVTLTRRLRRLAETARGPHVDWDASHARYQDFLEELSEHERIESDLIQEALLNDLGGGG